MTMGIFFMFCYPTTSGVCPSQKMTKKQKLKTCKRTTSQTDLTLENPPESKCTLLHLIHQTYMLYKYVVSEIQQSSSSHYEIQVIN